MVGWIDMKLGVQVGLSSGHIVLDGDPASLPKWTESPQFSANGWMDQMPLGTEVALGRSWPKRHCVRWGPSSPSPKKGGSAPPKFLAYVYCGHTAGWIKMPLGVEVGLGLGHIVLDGAQLPLLQKGAQPPNFRAMSIVAKRLHGSRCHIVWR